MIKDLNKAILAIDYNHLNLPTKVTFGTGNTLGSDEIRYVYDATGTKLEKKVVDMSGSNGNYGMSINTTEYAGGFIYERSGSYGHDGQFWMGAEVGLGLQMFSHPEGYVERKTSGSYNYAYQYKDHLGNIRLTYMDNNGSLDIIEEHNYYPFGLKHKGYNDVVSANANSIAQKFKYNGIELEESLGVDWYEMDVRQYDPAVARFTSIDPVIHYDFSTYNAFDNNPVFWADPSGANAGCPSCQTEEDWENYYSQAENTAMMVGDESAYDGFGRVTSMLDENGNSLVYLDGELQDLVVYDNWLDAVSSTISDGLLIEAPLLLGKVISNVFKSGGDEAVEAVVKADNLSVSEQVVAEAKRVNPNANTTTLTPGENVGSSIPARSKSQTFTKAERTKINEIGSAEGCHTCGTTNSGRTSGNFTPDHQPPSSLVPNGTSQRLYPHCAGCSASQGGTVSSLRRKGYNIFNIDNNLHN